MNELKRKQAIDNIERWYSMKEEVTPRQLIKKLDQEFNIVR